MAEEIRFVGELTRLQPKPGDRFVLTCEERLSDEQARRLGDRLQEFLGQDAKVIVLDKGLRLGLIGEAA